MTRRNSKRQEIVISSEAGDCPIVISSEAGDCPIVISSEARRRSREIYFLKYFPITGISASGRSFFTMYARKTTTRTVFTRMAGQKPRSLLE